MIPCLRSCAGGLVLLLLISLSGCVTSSPRSHRQVGESLVFIGEQPMSLACLPRDPILLRSTFRPQSNTVTYLEGVDYFVDHGTGTLRRTPRSRIPDFRNNLLYGATNFDHSKFPGFGNTAFFAFADYQCASKPPWPVQVDQRFRLSRSVQRLNAGGLFKVVAFGDSITAGGDATSPDLIFWSRWVDHLRKTYPQASITAVNGATGGDSTVQGLQRLEAKVLREKPDLVLIGFGMNDHNRGGVPVPQFAENLRTLVRQIRAETSAEVILFSAFPPNPQWAFGTHHMEDYAWVTAEVADELGAAYADVFNNWEAIARRKKTEDLLGNNINHPNDFGHDLYYQVFLKLGL